MITLRHQFMCRRIHGWVFLQPLWTGVSTLWACVFLTLLLEFLAQRRWFWVLQLDTVAMILTVGIPCLVGTDSISYTEEDIWSYRSDYHLLHSELHLFNAIRCHPSQPCATDTSRASPPSCPPLPNDSAWHHCPQQSRKNYTFPIRWITRCPPGCLLIQPSSLNTFPPSATKACPQTYTLHALLV